MVVEVSLQRELVAGDPITRRDPAGHGSGTWTGAAGVPRRGRLRICRSATARLIAQAAPSSPTADAAGRWLGPLGRIVTARVLSAFTRQQLKPAHPGRPPRDRAGHAGHRRTHPLDEAADALRYVGAGHTRGKVVVTV
jgi:hypothetical protein